MEYSMTFIAKTAQTTHIEVPIKLRRENAVDMLVVMNFIAGPTAVPTGKTIHDSDDRAAVFPLVGVVKKFLLRHARSTTTIWRQQPVPSIVEVIDRRLHTVSDVSQRLVGMDWLLILWRYEPMVLFVQLDDSVVRQKIFRLF